MNRHMRVACVCHQFKNWWLHFCSPIPGRATNRIDRRGTQNPQHQTVLGLFAAGDSKNPMHYYASGNPGRRCKDTPGLAQNFHFSGAKFLLPS